jgi:hypothetical protein
VDRRVKLTPAFTARLAARFACQGRCVYPASATDSTTRALHGSFGPRITASTGFHR